MRDELKMIVHNMCMCGGWVGLRSRDGDGFTSRGIAAIYAIENRLDLYEECSGVWFAGRLGMYLDLNFGDVLLSGGTVMVAVNNNLHTFYEGNGTDGSLRGAYLDRWIKREYNSEVIQPKIVCGHVPFKGVQGG